VGLRQENSYTPEISHLLRILGATHPITVVSVLKLFGAPGSLLGGDKLAERARIIQTIPTVKEHAQACSFTPDIIARFVAAIYSACLRQQGAAKREAPTADLCDDNS
jgi:hypothetical protein